MIGGWRGAVRSGNHGLGAVATVHLTIGRHAVAVAVEHSGAWAEEEVQECELNPTQREASQAVVQPGSVTQCCQGCLRLSKG